MCRKIVDSFVTDICEVLDKGIYYTKICQRDSHAYSPYFDTELIGLALSL